MRDEARGEEKGSQASRGSRPPSLASATEAATKGGARRKLVQREGCKGQTVERRECKLVCVRE
jgi:hypothetical protein